MLGRLGGQHKEPRAGTLSAVRGEATFRFESQLRVIARKGDDRSAHHRRNLKRGMTGERKKKKRYRLFLSQCVEPTTICFSGPEENVHPCKSHLPALQLVSYIHNASLHTVWKNSSFNTVSSPFLPPSFLPPRLLLCKESSRLLMLPIFLFTWRGEKLSVLPLFVYLLFSLFHSDNHRVHFWEKLLICKPELQTGFCWRRLTDTCASSSLSGPEWFTKCAKVHKLYWSKSWSLHCCLNWITLSGEAETSEKH